jgi:serine/threonine-protein kinase
MELDPGTTIGGRYIVDEPLGEGGMAVVYRARHAQLNTKHAVKILTIRSRGVRERMLQEGRVQAQLRHPNIVSVTDVVTIEGSPALVMELIDGPPLDELLVQQKLTIDQADAIGRGVLAAVTHAHERGLIHRDLKPANIMLEIEGGEVTPKVTDFGLAKLLDGDEKAAATRTGSTMGTPQYMSPEQIIDTKNVDERSDVFALGAILYELVTGERAFDGENVLKIFHRVSEADYVPAQELRADIPPRMLRAIEAALVVDRDERVGSARMLFEIFTDGEPLPASTFTSSEIGAMTRGNRPPTVPASSAPTPEVERVTTVGAQSATSIVRSPVVIGGGLFAVGAVALAVVLLLLGGIGAWVYTREPSEPTLVDPTEAPAPDGPDAPVAPSPPTPEPSIAAVQPTPEPGRPVEEPVVPVPEPGSLVPTENPDAPVEEPATPEPDEPVAPIDSGDPGTPDEPDEPEPNPDAPVEVVPPVPEPAVAPVPVAPAPAAPVPKTPTTNDVPMSMKSSGGGPAAIHSDRDDADARMNGWLIALMKDRELDNDIRAKAGETIAHRLDRGYAPVEVAETGAHYAARYGVRGSTKRDALRALLRKGTRLDGPIGVLKGNDNGSHDEAIDALVAIARRTGRTAEARAALTTFAARTDVRSKAVEHANDALQSL